MKKIFICLICILLLVGCKNNKTNNEKPQSEKIAGVYDPKVDSAKVADYKFVYYDLTGEHEIVNPLQVRRLYHKEFSIDILDMGVGVNEKIENHKMFFPNDSEEYITISAINATKETTMVRNCTITYLENSSKYLSVNGVSPKRTIYDEVIAYFGKDNKDRADKYHDEKEKGEVILRYESDPNYDKLETFTADGKVYNKIILEFYFDEHGTVTKYIFRWTY